jgi:hypothetical protein
VRDWNQLAAAVRAEVHDVAVVGARACLREIGVFGFGFPQEAHRGVEKRGGETFGVDALQAICRIHRAEGSEAAVARRRVPFVVARRPHRGESAKPAAAEDLRRLAADFEVFEALGVVADSDGAVLEPGFDIAVPQAGVFEDVAVRIDGAGEGQFLDFFGGIGHC